MEIFPGTIVADRFRLERELGQGGMGVVWLARHLGLDVPCAIKFIIAQAAQSPELRDRFEREARAAAHIKSSNVVQILDYGVWQDTPYIAMEYLDGEDLGSRLARRGRLEARETATMIGQVARALGKAHAMGIIHRDIKPSNIFLVRDEEGEIVKVVDFGIAKSHSLAISQGHTRTGALIGTPSYMSPEQVQGNKTVDFHADLWALGVVAFQCLTGKLPFASDGFGDLVMNIIANPLPVPSSIAPVPPGFDAWWARAAERDPAKRFQSAKELAETLYIALGISAGSAAELRDSTPPGLSTPVGQDVVRASTPPSPLPTPSDATLPITPSSPLPTPAGAALPLTPSSPLPTPAPVTPSSPIPTPVSLMLPVTPMPRARKGAFIVAMAAAATVVLVIGIALIILLREPSHTTEPAGAPDVSADQAPPAPSPVATAASGTIIDEAPPPSLPVASSPEPTEGAPAASAAAEPPVEPSPAASSAPAAPSASAVPSASAPWAPPKYVKPKPRPGSDYIND